MFTICSFRCVPCQCNNQSDSCHPETGICVCGGNTLGPKCESCKPGFYIKLTSNTPIDCQLCPCLFSTQCVFIDNRVKCINCPEGHKGDRCEICSDGYYGNLTGTVGKLSRFVNTLSYLFI